jgi:hypothetical protein
MRANHRDNDFDGQSVSPAEFQWLFPSVSDEICEGLPLTKVYPDTSETTNCSADVLGTGRGVASSLISRDDAIHDTAESL